VRGQPPYVDPAPEKVGSIIIIDPMDPVAPRPLRYSHLLVVEAVSNREVGPTAKRTGGGRK